MFEDRQDIITAKWQEVNRRVRKPWLCRDALGCGPGGACCPLSKGTILAGCGLESQKARKIKTCVAILRKGHCSKSVICR